MDQSTISVNQISHIFSLWLRCACDGEGLVCPGNAQFKDTLAIIETQRLYGLDLREVRHVGRLKLHKHATFLSANLRMVCLVYTDLFNLYLSLSTGHFRWNLSHFLNKVWEEREARPVLICWVQIKEASGTIFIKTLVWGSRVSNPRPTVTSCRAVLLGGDSAMIDDKWISMSLSLV